MNGEGRGKVTIKACWIKNQGWTQQWGKARKGSGGECGGDSWNTLCAKADELTQWRINWWMERLGRTLIIRGWTHYKESPGPLNSFYLEDQSFLHYSAQPWNGGKFLECWKSYRCPLPYSSLWLGWIPWAEGPCKHTAALAKWRNPTRYNQTAF